MVKEKSKYLFLLCIILLTCFFSGCSNRVLRSGSFEDPTLLPDKRRIGAALKSAAFQPQMGITAAALVVTAASGKDKQISYYAAKNTPVFGSIENAKRASDLFVIASAGAAALTYSIKYLPLHSSSDQDKNGDGCPIGSEFGISPRLHAPVAAASAGALSLGLTSGSTHLLKITTGRLRPDSSNVYSFPSGHTSSAAVANAYTARMISSMSLPKVYSYPAYAALTTLTIATAWGRIEGEKHYPADVLAGALIGTFFANAAYSAFLGPHQNIENFNVRIVPRGAAMTASILF